MMRNAIAAFALCWLSLPGLPGAAEAPQTPCSGEPAPAYPPVGNSPVIDVWLEHDLDGGWTPDRCLGWSAGSGLAIAALAGSFTEAGGMPAVLSRLAAISAQTGIIYWSDSRQNWRPLFSESWALSGPAREGHRNDFAPAEVAAGNSLYFWQRANELYGGAVYRLEVKASDGQHLEAAETNITPITLFGIELVPADGQQAHFWIEAESPDHYRYYAISRLTGDIPFGVTRVSMINRIVAMFRYAAGIPTDQLPLPDQR